MVKCGKTSGKSWGDNMEKVRESWLKSYVSLSCNKKSVKNNHIYALDLHKLMQGCEKELMGFKIKITESTIST